MALNQAVTATTQIGVVNNGIEGYAAPDDLKPFLAVDITTASQYPLPLNDTAPATPAYVDAALADLLASLPDEVSIASVTYDAPTGTIELTESSGTVHSIVVPLWTETVRGLVEKADLIESGQDRDLGAGNLFSIAAPVGVLDDIRGMTPEKTYATVRKNFFIDTAVTINLITDARFPTPQSVLNWLAGKRILSAGSVTINVPDGFHDFTGSGVMRAHPDSSKITWRSLTAPLPYSRADMVEVGATAASHSAAHATNYAMLQGKFGAELKLPAMNYVDNWGFGNFRNLLISAAIVLSNARMGSNNCAFISSDRPISVTHGGKLEMLGSFAAMSQTNTAVTLDTGGQFICRSATATTVIYVAGLFGFTVTAHSGAASNIGVGEWTIDGRVIGIYAPNGGEMDIGSSDLLIIGHANNAVYGRGNASICCLQNSATQARFEFRTAAVTAVVTPAIRLENGSSIRIGSAINIGSSLSVFINSAGGQGIKADDHSEATIVYGNVTFTGCNYDMFADDFSEIILPSAATVFSAGALDNAQATNGSRIKTAGSTLPAGSIPVFGVADATGALVF